MVTVHLFSAMMALSLIPRCACPDPEKSVRGEHEGFNRPSLTPPTGRASLQPHLSQPKKVPEGLLGQGKRLPCRPYKLFTPQQGLCVP